MQDDRGCKHFRYILSRHVTLGEGGTVKYRIILFRILYIEIALVNLHAIHCIRTTEHFPVPIPYLPSIM
jgi:hypothetical protein